MDGTPEPGPAGPQPHADAQDGGAAATTADASKSTVTKTSRRGTALRVLTRVLAVLVVAAGLGGSFLVARNAARKDAAKARNSFATGAAGVASSLDLTLQREEDLVTAAGAFFAEHPKATPSDFKNWAERVHVFRRYPELQKVGLVTIVRETQLAEFQAQITGHALPRASTDAAGSATSTTAGTTPAASAATESAIKLIPPGERGY
ncbi:MAG TPA: hypothetical protein VH025_00420, partial [Solirubrobacteraceae bacterium]|nr:hypothetical protein [Solirubrobacteraceae bacterium]